MAANAFHSLVQSVHAATRRTLLKVKGLSEIKVEKIKEAIAKCQVRFRCPSTLLSSFLPPES